METNINFSKSNAMLERLQSQELDLIENINKVEVYKQKIEMKLKNLENANRDMEKIYIKELKKLNLAVENTKSIKEKLLNLNQMNEMIKRNNIVFKNNLKETTKDINVIFQELNKFPKETNQEFIENNFLKLEEKIQSKNKKNIHIYSIVIVIQILILLVVILKN